MSPGDRPGDRSLPRRAPRCASFVLAALGLATAPAAAKPVVAMPRSSGAPVRAQAPKVKHDGAHARVAINHAGALRPARDAVGRREEPLTAEEETAREIERLLHGPLRYGVTGLFVADARTGEPLFAVNADDPLNPASNVKLISTATALELLGSDFKYPTRLLGATPDGGVVHGDVYLLGSYDPTLTTADIGDLAAAVAARGINEIDGKIVVGRDPTRDGIYRAIIPIEVRGGEPGTPPIAAAPAGMNLVTIKMTAKSGPPSSRPGRSRLTYRVDSSDDGAGHPRVVVTIGGTIPRGSGTMYPLITRERTALAAYALRAALLAHGVTVGDDFKVEELDDFVAGAVAAGGLPVELARHESPRLAQIIARVNKWSVNWLADRVIMTAAALVKREPPSMDLAVAAMYDWLSRHPGIPRTELVVDTGSGLSYHTRITAHELVSIMRSAAGFASDADVAQSHAWLSSLSIAGTDGTLSSRFRASDVRGRMRGKTGTLSTAIALSGVLDIDPQRPLVFSLITNGDAPLSKGYVRRAHEQVVALICHYLARTRKDAPPADVQAPLELPQLPPDPDRPDPEEMDPDAALDEETASQR